MKKKTDELVPTTKTNGSFSVSQNVHKQSTVTAETFFR